MTGGGMGRQRRLASGAGFDVRLSWYAPGAHMDSHVHDRHQVSWLLAGELRERSAGREFEFVDLSRGIKPAGCPHANVYGRSGSLVLALNIDPESDLCDAIPGLDDWRWSASDGERKAVHDVLAAATMLADGNPVTDLALADVVAGTHPAPGQTGDAPDPWLSRVRDWLHDDPDAHDLSGLAAAAGVHRVHLSRSFTRHYGLPPSLYRLRCKVSRALADLVGGASLAAAAQTGGFADQAHFTRATRRQTGLTPSHLRTLLAA